MTVQDESQPNHQPATEAMNAAAPSKACRPVCPICGGRLIEIRAKLHCAECHTILETCCEGGAQG